MHTGKENINTFLADLIVKMAKLNGVQYFNTSPGLRNAPLLNALNKTDNLITSNFDERAAGFRALAQCKINGKPNALLCTSGTALTNYFPSIIESFYQELPLIIISSDRPKKNIIARSNQSINQEYIFGEYVKHNLNIPAPSPKTDIKKLCIEIDKFFKLVKKDKTPGHLNVSFWDPANLDESMFSIEELAIWKEINFSDYRFQKKSQEKSLETITFETDSINSPDLISFGEQEIDLSVENTELKNAFINFIKDLKTPFTIDVTSGFKYQFLDHPYYLPSLDHPEFKELLEKKEINNVWHFGRRMTSKHFYRFLQNKQPVIHTFSTAKHEYNPSFCQNHFHQINSSLLGDLCFKLIKKETIQSTETIRTKQQIIENGPLSFPYISKKAIELNKHENSLLVLGNSTSIRSFDYFSSDINQISPIIYTHRGASGIEGFLAAIKGIDDSLPSLDSSGNKYIINAYLGDITFQHDLNSILLFRKIKHQINIFIVNDYGGGIFRLLNINEMKNCTEEMITPHEIEFTDILKPLEMKFHHLKVKQIQSKADYLIALNTASDDRLNIYEIILNETENNQVYQCLRTIKS